MRRLPLHETHAERGARFAAGEGALVPAAYGEVAAEARLARRGPVVTDRSQRGRLAFFGADRAAFLHGQCSSDVRGLRPGEGQLTTVLSGKGKMRGAGILRALPDHLLLTSAGDALAPLQAHLGAFLVLEDVRIEDRGESFVELGVHGPGARAAVAKALSLELPSLATHGAVVRDFAGGPLVLADERATGGEGVAILAPAAAAAELWRRLVTVLPPIGWEAMEVLRVEAGLPRFGAEADEDTLPPEVGLDAALSFTKGCYTGYEVMARIRTYGHVNRQLVGLVLEGKEAAAPGDVVRDGERTVGAVTSAVVSPALGQPIALAVIRREAAAPGVALAVERAAGGERMAATVVTLPFVAPEVIEA